MNTGIAHRSFLYCVNHALRPRKRAVCSYFQCRMCRNLVLGEVPHPVTFCNHSRTYPSASARPAIGPPLVYPFGSHVYWGGLTYTSTIHTRRPRIGLNSCELYCLNDGLRGPGRSVPSVIPAQAGIHLLLIPWFQSSGGQAPALRASSGFGGTHFGEFAGLRLQSFLAARICRCQVIR